MQRIINSILCVLVILAMVTSISNAAPPATGGYIVVLHDNVASPAAAASDIAKQVTGKVGFVYEHALKGFSITLPPQAVAALEKNPNVKYVATDDIRYASAQTVPTGIQRIFAPGNGGISIDGTDDWRVDVDVAVIDTGIDFEHPDLNVVGGADCTTGNFFRVKCVDGGDDDHYHGTHVAGTIGAIDNEFGVVGVAPGARLWAVKVLDSQGSGWSSWVIAGIDWVAKNARTIAVANMSLSGSGYNQAEYDAIQGAVNKGVAFAVAAGNEADDAANYSPAAFDNVLTVSALADYDGEPGDPENYDALAYFSNWGAAVDIAAPGVNILSTFPVESGEYYPISGTSMASPHVAGALALLASGYNKPSDANGVYALYNKITGAGNYDWTDDSGDDIQEPLLDVSSSTVFAPVLVLGNGGGTPLNEPPVVIISNPSNGVSFDSGTSIFFEGTGIDNEDGDLSSDLIWISDLDGQIGTGGSFSAMLSQVGTHNITASVTDSGGKSDNDSITIIINEVSSGDISLSVSAYKVRGAGVAELEWSRANSGNVDIERNGSIIDTTDNDGIYTDNDLGKGGGSATYRVCEAGTSTCSNEVTVTW